MAATRKRKHPEEEQEEEELSEAVEEVAEKKRRRVMFENVTVFHFSRRQGHTCVPSQVRGRRTWRSERLHKPGYVQIGLNI